METLCSKNSGNPVCKCKYCGRESSSVHSLYQRSVQDLPIQGHTTTLLITSRKMFCKNPQCSHKTFSETFSFIGKNALAMKHLGVTKESGRSGRIKWGCPKMQYSKGQWHCLCKNPCSTAKKGRTAYTNENMSFRWFPGIQRNTGEWVQLYKIRTIVERAIYNDLAF